MVQKLILPLIDQGGASNNQALTWSDSSNSWVAANLPAGINTAAQYTFSNTITFTANVVLSGNSTSVLYVGNSTVYTTVNATSFSGVANNALFLNGQNAAYYTDIVSRLGYTPANKAGDTFTGNVGIGVAPTGKLQTELPNGVYGNAYYHLAQSYNGNVPHFTMYMDGQWNTVLATHVSGSGGTPGLLLVPSGNVSIGSINTPTAKLQITGAGGTTKDLRVNGRIQTGDASDFGGIWFGANTSQEQFIGQYSATDMGFYLASNWRVVMAANGNVGIGTTAPVNLLDVNGHIGIKAGNALRLYNANNGSYASMAFGANTVGYVNINYALELNSGGNDLYLNGPTSNYIRFNTSGIAAPYANSTISPGTKVLLYETGSGGNYGIGITGSTFWSSVQASAQFVWYGGSAAIASLDTANNTFLIANIVSTNFTLQAQLLRI